MGNERLHKIGAEFGRAAAALALGAVCEVGLVFVADALTHHVAEGIQHCDVYTAPAARGACEDGPTGEGFAVGAILIGAGALAGAGSAGIAGESMVCVFKRRK